MPSYPFRCECGAKKLRTLSVADYNELTAVGQFCECGKKMSREYTPFGFSCPAELTPIEQQLMLEHKEYLEEGVREGKFELKGKNNRGMRYEPELEKMKPVKRELTREQLIEKHGQA